MTITNASLVLESCKLPFASSNKVYFEVVYIFFFGNCNVADEVWALT